MTYQVIIIQDAEEDLLEIYRYIFEHDSEQSANYVLNSLEELCNSLDQMPERGHVPPELRRISVSNYLEVHFKPYRVIYEIEEKKSLFIVSWMAGGTCSNF